MSGQIDTKRRQCMVALLVCCSAAGCSWMRQRRDRATADSQRLVERARQSEQQGKLDEAAELLNQAARVNPEDAEVHRRLAEILVARGDNQAAAEHLRAMVQLTPDDPRGWLELARTQYVLQAYNEVDAPLQRALELDSASVPALLLMARLEQLRRQDAGALEAYHRVLGVEPENIDAMLGIASIHLRTRRPERAAPLLRSICHCPSVTQWQSAEARRMLGIAYGQEHRWADAALALGESLPGHPAALPDDWYRLAFARAQTGDGWGARQAARQALVLDPTHESARVIAGSLPATNQTQGAGIVPAGHRSRMLPVPAGW